MKNRSESNDWLILILWALDTFLNPSPRNILESFESWDYRNRLRPQLKQLRRSGLLARQSPGKRSQWRLTEQGRLAAGGGIDPASRWSRRWDGRWRLMLFDLPGRQQRLRLALWRWLQRQRFGYLQHSVWIVPDPIHESSIPLRHLKLTPESLTVIEGAPAPPDTNADIVRSAWDFALINRQYMAAIESAIAGRRFAQSGKPGERRSWLSAEGAAWSNAVSNDPLLPEALLPADYLGQKAWHERQITFSLLGKSLPGRNKT